MEGAVSATVNAKKRLTIDRGEGAKYPKCCQALAENNIFVKILLIKPNKFNVLHRYIVVTGIV